MKNFIIQCISPILSINDFCTNCIAEVPGNVYLHLQRGVKALLAAALLISGGCAIETQGPMVLVEGGRFKNSNSNFQGKDLKVPSFYIGKKEVTQEEWVEIMGYNPSKFIGDSLPVEMVTWYESVLFCNKKSIKEGLQPYYNIVKNEGTCNGDTIIWDITINKGANGYRLPTLIEWEFAASGGRESRNYKFSGSNELDEVGWYWRNSGDIMLTGYFWDWPAIERNNGRTHPVGLKKPNELGIYDMSGNVREWCQDWYEAPGVPGYTLRVQRGGGWLGGDHACAISFIGKFEPLGKGPDQGLRLARSR